MLEKTVDDLVKYVALKSFLNQNPNDKIVDEAIKLLYDKIKNDLKDDQKRLDKIAEAEKRIKKKEEAK